MTVKGRKVRRDEEASWILRTSFSFTGENTFSIFTVFLCDSEKQLKNAVVRKSRSSGYYVGELLSNGVSSYLFNIYNQ